MIRPFVRSSSCFILFPDTATDFPGRNISPQSTHGYINLVIQGNIFRSLPAETALYARFN